MTIKKSTKKAVRNKLFVVLGVVLMTAFALAIIAGCSEDDDAYNYRDYYEDGRLYTQTDYDTTCIDTTTYDYATEDGIFTVKAKSAGANVTWIETDVFHGLDVKEIKIAGTSGNWGRTNFPYLHLYDNALYGIDSVYGGQPRYSLIAYPSNCTATSITLDAQCYEINPLAFYGNTTIQDINVMNKQYFDSVDGILFDDTTLILCPPGRTGTITIPETTQALDYYAFTSSRVEKLDLGLAEPEFYSKFSFKDCDLLNEFIVSEDNLTYAVDPNTGCLMSKDGTKLYFCPPARPVENGIFTIPASVEWVRNGAFAGCKNIKAFAVEEGNTRLTVDSDGVLYDLNSDMERVLVTAYPTGKVSEEGKKLTFSSDLPVAAFAFVGSNIEEVTLTHPKSISDAYFSFENCKSLKKVVIAGGDFSYINKYTFDGCSGLEEIWAFCATCNHTFTHIDWNIAPYSTIEYGIWTKDPETGKVSISFLLNLNKNNPDAVGDDKIEKLFLVNGDRRYTYTLPTADEIGFGYEGHRLVGWATSPNGDAEYLPGQEMSTTSCKQDLYAVWAEGDEVAKIGDTVYSLKSLADRWDATVDGRTLVLKENVGISETVKVMSGCNLTIDFNGHKIYSRVSGVSAFEVGHFAKLKLDMTDKDSRVIIDYDKECSSFVAMKGKESNLEVIGNNDKWQFIGKDSSGHEDVIARIMSDGSMFEMSGSNHPKVLLKNIAVKTDFSVLTSNEDVHGDIEIIGCYFEQVMKAYPTKKVVVPCVGLNDCTSRISDTTIKTDGWPCVAPHGGYLLLDGKNDFHTDGWSVETEKWVRDPILCRQNPMVVILDGSYRATDNEGAAIHVTTNAHIIIYGGTFESEDTLVTRTALSAYSSMAVYGGTFKGKIDPLNGGIAYQFMGGTFDRQPDASYLMPGFICSPTSDGKYIVTEDPASANPVVATCLLGDKTHAMSTLEDAMSQKNIRLLTIVKKLDVPVVDIDTRMLVMPDASLVVRESFSTDSDVYNLGHIYIVKFEKSERVLFNPIEYTTGDKIDDLDNDTPSGMDPTTIAAIVAAILIIAVAAVVVVHHYRK